MWNVKAKVKPIIVGATGTISKSPIQYLRNMPGEHEIKEVYKTAILGTAHILWGSIVVKVSNTRWKIGLGVQ